MTVKIGLIVNPIAGMGGRVGLKGTDGNALMFALERGAVPFSEDRAVACLKEIADSMPDNGRFTLCTGPDKMGERAAYKAGIVPHVLQATRRRERTVAEDTIALARVMFEQNTDLILFVGGDGTARDICQAVGEHTLVLGVPAGVKMHSAVFTSSPKQAGVIASKFIETCARAICFQEKTAEVMDIDEEAYRNGALKARLYGYLRVPHLHGRLQNLKSGSSDSDAASQSAIAHSAAEAISTHPETLYLIGAGTTTRALLEELGVKGTLLGIDAWLGDALLACDLGEKEILDLLGRHERAAIVITPIGGQGFIFGRGNQQFSPQVIRRVGRENILLLAAPAKLMTLGTAPLLVDTGDPELDKELEGYYKIVSGYGKYVMHRVERG